MKAKLVSTALMVLFISACSSNAQLSESTAPGPTPAEVADAPAASPSVVTQTVTRTVTATVTVTAEPEDEPDEAPDSGSSSFESALGETAYFTQGSGADEVELAITVGQPKEAVCRYRSLGCDAPETGDRVVSVPIVIENLGDAQAEVSSGLFEIEFADGTRLGPDDGAASDYSSDADLGYSRTIRPGGTLNTSLTFEAPDGEFGIVMMTNSFNGEDLHIWLGS